MEPSIISIVVFCATVIFVYMTIWFLIAIAIKRNDIADIAWGLGFSTLAVLVPRNGQFSQDLVIRLLIIVWGVRLSCYIYRRLAAKSEDYRYQQWRQQCGKWVFIRSYLHVFILQGVFMLLISAPIIIASTSLLQPHPVFYWIGLCVWVVGCIFECVGDWQLSQFTKNRKHSKAIMKLGLWKFTRHPNYFGEVTQWWGIFCMVCTMQYGWFAIISPITITVLILGVSGIPMLEQRYKGISEYDDYKKRTSPFFPWFPKQPI